MHNIVQRTKMQKEGLPFWKLLGACVGIFWGAQKLLCGCAALGAGTHLTVTPGWPGTGWAWHMHPPSGSTCYHSGKTEEGTQHRRKKGIRKGSKGRTAWLLGVLLLVGQESTSGNGTGRSELVLLHECHGFLGTVSWVCHWLDSLPSPGHGAQEAVFPLLVLVPVAWQLSWSPGEWPGPGRPTWTQGSLMCAPKFGTEKKAQENLHTVKAWMGCLPAWVLEDVAFF